MQQNDDHSPQVQLSLLSCSVHIFLSKSRWRWTAFRLTLLQFPSHSHTWKIQPHLRRSASSSVKGALSYWPHFLNVQILTDSWDISDTETDTQSTIFNELIRICNVFHFIRQLSRWTGSDQIASWLPTATVITQFNGNFNFECFFFIISHFTTQKWQSLSIDCVQPYNN